MAASVFHAPAWLDPWSLPSPKPKRGSLRLYDFGPGSRAPDPEEARRVAETLRGQARRRGDAARAAEREAYARVPVPRRPLYADLDVARGLRARAVGDAPVASIPTVGLGTWKAERGEVRAATHAALRAGYRHLDCAAVYANEAEVGEAIEAALTSGGVAREDLFVCSKVWNVDHAARRVRAACERSLADLRLRYLDLYLIHWPITGIPGEEVVPSIRETWEAMEALVDAGLVRAIGVSNFSKRKLERILEHARIPPSVVQVEVHPYWRNDDVLGWCRTRGIHVTAFSPLGSPDSASIFPRAKPLDLRSDRTVVAAAEALGRNVGQILIRWALQHGTSVIPKSVSPSRIAGNLAVLDWELPPEIYAELSSLPEQQRMVNGASFLNPRGPYRTLEDLWDEPDEGTGVSSGPPIPFPLVPPPAAADAPGAPEPTPAALPRGDARKLSQVLPPGSSKPPSAPRPAPTPAPPSAPGNRRRLSSRR